MSSLDARLNLRSSGWAVPVASETYWKAKPNARRALQRQSPVHHALLLNLPQPDQLTVIEQKVSRLKPGGLIALQEYDAVSLVCFPELPLTILLDAYANAFRSHGGNRATGRTLHSLLRSVGVGSIEMKAHARHLEVGDSQRTVLLTLVELVQDRIIGLGRFSESEFKEHQKKLSLDLADPDTLVIDRLLVQAWGRKPL